ncbi:DUF1569 domain-containing protein [Chitinophaga silvatica]|uniref:DUF1569 domain-containing protein n=1 Tax=Chitinophaga silvatica TaxID=2282649 RepID=A0A3E1Y934_9BACT|nr:DUF1569 domain-containing protein [Chitinophaga silvatica]RFS21915.1 DUF1569 domain-containing protein [Chitinophaga silvatica]
MKTIFDKNTRDEIIRRVVFLHENSTPVWGKMTPYQMLKHCSLWEEMAQGKTTYKQVLIGKLVGRFVLKSILKNEAPLRRNAPSTPDLVITYDGNVELQKKIWIGLLEEYENFVEFDFIHPFFGRVTTSQIGMLAYKHADHHLRQFNC